jgi:drug/metabolite transporter (DMT)-like permease
MTPASHQSSNRSSLIFLGSFAALIALRDVAKQLVLHAEDSISFAAVLTGTIAVVSLLLMLLTRGSASRSRQHLRRGRVMASILALGLAAALVYGVTFTMIDNIGAGLFNMIDYGAAPILTAVLGIAFFHNRGSWWLVASLGLYLVGIVFLHERRDVNWAWVALALVSPLATSASDALTTWLLRSDGGGLSKLELLFFRFSAASLALLAFAALKEHPIEIVDWPATMAVALTLGFVPMWLLCKGLTTGTNTLVRLAVSEYAIPLLAFMLTLPWQPEHHAPLPLIGAALVLLALGVGNEEIRALLHRRKAAHADAGLQAVELVPIAAARTARDQSSANADESPSAPLLGATDRTVPAALRSDRDSVQ